MLYRNITILASIFVLTSCEKLKNDNHIPDDLPRLTELQKEYTDILTHAAHGWYIDYAPSDEQATVPILIEFLENGKARILSDRNGFNEEEISTFRVGGVTRPELIFDTYSIWSAIAENDHGNFEFLMQLEGNDKIILKNIFNDTDQEFILRKATPLDRENIIAQAKTAQLLKSFNENATAYFKNVLLEKVSAFWQIDLDKQQLTLSWEENSEIRNQTFSYNYTPHGIKLIHPWTPENLSVQDIIFGEVTDNAMEIISAGSAGAGQIAVSHTPAFPYEGAADLFIQENGAVRFYAYTLDVLEDYYSPALIPEFLQFKEATGAETFRVQLYNNSPAGSGNNSMQMRFVLPDNESGWMLYAYDIEKRDESHVIVTPLGTSNTVGTPYLDQALEFMSKIFPPEGITVVPYGRAGNLQRIRLVSRQDSRYYMTVTVSTPADVYID